MHKHLTLEERHYIDLEKNSSTLTSIAKALNRSVSTVSREIKNNSGSRGYRYKQANIKSANRRSEKPKFRKITEEMIVSIGEYLKENWSPDQISERFKLENKACISYSTIYRHINADKNNKGNFYMHLRRKGRKRRKPYAGGKKGAGIPNRVDISMRSDEINQRERVGDWEGDTMIGSHHKGCIVTVDERKTKLRLAFPLNSKECEPVSAAIISLLTPFKDFFLSITFDNGKEFAAHEKISNSLGNLVYFATPYHSWERGQNENANGLLRQYFPKGMKLIDITVDSVMLAVDKLNSRPRKCLGYKTPYEAFFEATGINARDYVVLHL